MTANAKDIPMLLEKLYKKYSRRECIPPEPLQFVYLYKNKPDMEIAAFLSAMFAYGAVEQIEKFLLVLFGKMGKSPAALIRRFSKKDERKFQHLKYRFNTGGDIISLLKGLKKILRRFGSLEKLFLHGYDEKNEDIVPAAEKFIAEIKNACPNQSRGLKFLLSSPAGGGSAKRLFLFLRWLVRKDNVDVGLWKSVDKAKLIVPVDVHIGRLSRILGFHNKKTVNLKTAIEITKAFKKFSPDDPAKYDFALCRIGITENCSGKKNKYCLRCELAGFCKRKG